MSAPADDDNMYWQGVKQGAAADDNYRGEGDTTFDRLKDAVVHRARVRITRLVFAALVVAVVIKHK